MKYSNTSKYDLEELTKHGTPENYPFTQIGSPELGKRATIYKSGLVVYRTWTKTTLGENSHGWEVKYKDNNTARKEANKWLGESQ